MPSSRKYLFYIVFLYFSLVFSAFVHAEQGQPRYKIEVVVFKALLTDESSENWQPATETASGRIEAGMTKTDQPNPVKYHQQPTANSNLDTLMQRLTKSGEYHVLDYRAWYQYADARSVSPAAYYENNYENIGNLKGSIQFYVSRFLHLNINLDLVPEYFNPEKVIRKDGDNAESIRPVYTIRQSKRVSSEKYYYFDHPEFGVIAYIKPMES